MNYPFKTLLCLDFETYWDSKEYTLSKMTTEAYIRDPQFHAFGMGVHEFGSSDEPLWIPHAKLPRFFSRIDWTTTAVLAHNARFDVGIMSFVYGVRPCFIFDSLSMGRALRGVEVGNSLSKLADAYGFPAKGTAVTKTDGMHAPLHPYIEAELAGYCKHDVRLCEMIFAKLLYRVDPNGDTQGHYPASELRLIDMTLRMFTHPALVLDVPMLEKALAEDSARLAAVLEKADITDEATLASNAKFAALLESMGVPAPLKVSKTTGKPALALAKSDALFQAMLNGSNEEVATLCEARLRVKSTLERTRAQRFIEIAGRGALPAPLNYYAALSGRWGGSDAVNLQNMKRGSFLRKAIMAPEGYVIGVGDLGQIEPRMLAWLSGYVAMLDIFRAGGDPYAVFGAQMFGIPGLSKESHPLLRQSAKSALLGAGYSLGWASFAGQLLTGFLGAPPVRYTKADAKMLGVTGADAARFTSWQDNVDAMELIPHTCTQEDLLIHCLAAKAIIDKYREAAEPVTDFWKLLGSLLESSLYGGAEYEHKGVLQFRKYEIELVNGMRLRYPDVQPSKDAKGRVQYTYAAGDRRVKLYAGKLANNVTQALARIVMTGGMLRIDKVYPAKLTVHDEGVYLIPEGEAKQGREFIHAEMVRAPKWALDIPLTADVGVGKRYGDLK